MAAKKKEEEQDQIDQLLSSKEFDGMHLGSRYGEDIVLPDVIPSGSLIFDELLGGGFRSSMWVRFFGEPETGKSSLGLSWAKRWQDFYPDDGFVVIFNAEGRITYDLLKRAGVNLDKSCFRIVDTNVSDMIWSMMDKLIKNNPGKKKYFFLVDSTDACQRLHDLDKNIGDAEKIGGSATIISTAGKKLSLLFSRSGHFLFMTSQVRDNVSTYSPSGNAGKGASGGNAPKFYSSLTGEIKKPWTDTYIYENPSDKKSKPIGRLVEIKFPKTFNEKSNTTILYPVKFGQGYWPEYEAMMYAQSYGLIEKKGAHYHVTDVFAKELEDNKISADLHFHGEKRMREHFDENSKLSSYVLGKVRKLLFSS